MEKCERHGIDMIKKRCACRLFKISMVICLNSVMLTGCIGLEDDTQWQKSVVDEISAENSSITEELFPEKMELQEENITKGILVHVCGAVAMPGVYELTTGSRVYEAIEAAGGMLPEADSNYLNLASQLQDGIQIQVFTKEEVLKQQSEGKQQASGQMDNTAVGKVNINTASAKELTQLSGIGDSRAEAIISYRNQHGTFSSIDQIKQVDGIKEGLFQKIKDKIIVN